MTDISHKASPRYSETRDSASRQGNLRRLAWFLDSSIPLPFTRFRIGAEAVIGLLPGIGDMIGALLSSYILAEAARLKVPNAVVIRMGINVLIDTLIGMVPVLGDFFDMAWKANRKNVELLEAYASNPEQVGSSSRWLVWALAAVFGVVLILLLMLGWTLLEAVWTGITA